MRTRRNGETWAECSDLFLQTPDGVLVARPIAWSAGYPVYSAADAVVLDAHDAAEARAPRRVGGYPVGAHGPARRA